MLQEMQTELIVSAIVQMREHFPLPWRLCRRVYLNKSNSIPSRR